MQTEIWFKNRKIKKDYRPVKIEYALNQNQQETVRTFFKYLLVLHDYGCSVNRVITAFRRARMTNERSFANEKC